MRTASYHYAQTSTARSWQRAQRKCKAQKRSWKSQGAHEAVMLIPSCMQMLFGCRLADGIWRLKAPGAHWPKSGDFARGFVFSTCGATSSLFSSSIHLPPRLMQIIEEKIFIDLPGHQRGPILFGATSHSLPYAPTLRSRDVLT